MEYRVPVGTDHPVSVQDIPTIAQSTILVLVQVCVIIQRMRGHDHTYLITPRMIHPHITSIHIYKFAASIDSLKGRKLVAQSIRNETTETF